MVPFLILPFKNIIIMYLVLLLLNHLISLCKCRRTSLYVVSFCCVFSLSVCINWHSLFHSLSPLFVLHGTMNGVSLFAFRYQVGYGNALWRKNTSQNSVSRQCEKSPVHVLLTRKFMYIFHIIEFISVEMRVGAWAKRIFWPQILRTQENRKGFHLNVSPEETNHL